MKSTEKISVKKKVHSKKKDSVIKICVDRNSEYKQFQIDKLYTRDINSLSSKIEFDEYVRSRHALLKALTRPFLGFVLNPKSKGL